MIHQYKFTSSESRIVPLHFLQNSIGKGLKDQDLVDHLKILKPLVHLVTEIEKPSLIKTSAHTGDDNNQLSQH